jgi:hypothetical protein
VGVGLGLSFYILVDVFNDVLGRGARLEDLPDPGLF